MVRSGPRGSPDGRHKNRLFCPRCGHESPTDGDWLVLPTASGAVYGCPACGADVTTRPVGEALPRHGPSPGGEESLVAGWVRLAFAWTPWPAILPSRACRARSHR